MATETTATASVQLSDYHAGQGVTYEVTIEAQGSLRRRPGASSCACPEFVARAYRSVIRARHADGSRTVEAGEWTRDRAAAEASIMRDFRVASVGRFQVD